MKILGNGAVTKALSVKAHAFSKSAEAAITAAGKKQTAFMREVVAVVDGGAEE